MPQKGTKAIRTLYVTTVGMTTVYFNSFPKCEMIKYVATLGLQYFTSKLKWLIVDGVFALIRFPVPRIKYITDIVSVVLNFFGWIVPNFIFIITLNCVIDKCAMFSP